MLSHIVVLRSPHTCGNFGVSLPVSEENQRGYRGKDLGIVCHCGDYDGDLYREDPLESVGAFGNIIVVDNLPVMPPENFAKLEGVVRMMYNQEMEDSRALFSSNIQYLLLPRERRMCLCWTMIPDEWKVAEIRSNKPGLFYEICCLCPSSSVLD
ncbi:hypothetical protein OPV22_001794 [Ensete ventricosum]|uniref:Uncharacterized protein n=1 Tax=Ensete ventricosum TaxID=4639 RepID=A0AAV8RW65_ENSVE|nr:hypothetical protein OPV22_001794 [Ensete ventricosum]